MEKKLFQALSSKIITGVITLSMLLLSSYEGNNAAFENFTATVLGSNVYIKANLISAFENDFEELFKSGQKIDIFFKVDIKDSERTVHEKEFKHSIIFNPLEQIYIIFLEDQNVQTSAVSLEELIEIISGIDYVCKCEGFDEGNISLSSHLKKVRLKSIDKEYDMMMLWKFKKPSVKQKYKKLITET